MKLYAPLYLPGKIVGFKTGKDFVITVVEFCRFNPNNGYTYNLTGFIGDFKEDELYVIPNISAYTKFEI